MAKRAKATFRADCWRAAFVLFFASSLAFCANTFSPNPLHIFAPAGPAVQTAPLTITVAELADAWKKDESILLLDVRSKDDFDVGHAPKALNISIDEFAQSSAIHAPTLRSVSTIVTMCDGDFCDKASDAAKILREAGYPDVRVLKGGWEAYTEAKLEVQESKR